MIKVTDTLPLGLLFNTIMPVLREPERQWCLDQWNRCNPNVLVEETKAHKLLSTLEFCLRRHGLWPEVPSALREVIQRSRQEQALRQLRILSQLQEIDEALEQISHSAVLLKGSALFYYPLYDCLGSRRQSDIDLLVLPEQVPDVVNCFQGLGYCFQGKYEPHRHYPHALPPLVRSKSVHLDVHLLHPNSHRQYQHFDAQIWHTARDLQDFQALRLPTATELFWHMALHGWLGPAQLRNLLDLDQLRHVEIVDLDLLAHRAREQNLTEMWTTLSKHLQELTQGQPSATTILRWEWLPSPWLQGTYSGWMKYHWRYLFCPNPLGLWSEWLDPVLRLPVIAWRLVRSLAAWWEYQFRFKEEPSWLGNGQKEY